MAELCLAIDSRLAVAASDIVPTFQGLSARSQAWRNGVLGKAAVRHETRRHVAAISALYYVARGFLPSSHLNRGLFWRMTCI
jgi:hypothetical protein